MKKSIYLFIMISISSFTCAMQIKPPISRSKHELKSDWRWGRKTMHEKTQSSYIKNSEEIEIEEDMEKMEKSIKKMHTLNKMHTLLISLDKNATLKVWKKGNHWEGRLIDCPKNGTGSEMIPLVIDRTLETSEQGHEVPEHPRLFLYSDGKGFECVRTQEDSTCLNLQNLFEKFQNKNTK